MEKSYIDRLSSFSKSLKNLSEAKNRDRKDSFVISGTIQKFSLTFDLAWKLMKDIMIQDMDVTDFALESPKEVLKKAYENNLIDDDKWMDMLKTRNNAIHDYDETIAEHSIDIIIDEYISLLEQFYGRINK